MVDVAAADQINDAKQALSRGDGAAAVAALNAVLTADPQDAEALYLLALCANLAGRAAEAERLLEAAHDADPSSSLIAHALGAFTVGRDPDRAFALFQQAISSQPDFAPALTALGNLYRGKGLLGEARDFYERALDADPTLIEVETNLGTVLHDQFRHREALERHERALSGNPDFVMAQSNRLLGLHYGDHASREDIFTAHLDWGKAVEGRVLPSSIRFQRDTDPDRRLRVGYVSPDFRLHPVGWFFQTLAAAHDPARVAVHCYALNDRIDDQTRAIRSVCHHWTAAAGMTDAALIGKIRDDRIDVLVDLAGHTAGNRLSVFAARAAPVQATWLGYPDTTGLTSIDYRISDAVADPDGSMATETLFRLDGGFLCYRAPVDLPVAKTRGRRTGVRFGSFNNLAKLNDGVVACWAGILDRVPGAHLVLKARSLSDPETVARCRRAFGAHGIDPARLDLRGSTVALEDSFAAYNDIDIALDPFPYNGTTTTFDALWMGTPVVALSGDRHAARVGVSILTHAGLPDLVAGSTSAYADLAVALALDAARLERLTTTLRDRLQASPLTDARGFALRMEDAYRVMWRRWCESAGALWEGPA